MKQKEITDREQTKQPCDMGGVSKSLIVIGCNYHTTWQKHKAMRFVLAEVKGNKARLQTRTSRRDFWTDLKDLIFIESGHNIRKAKRLSGINVC